MAEDQEHRERESKVADAIDDERLVPGRGSELLQEVITDEQIAAQSDAFPANKQHQEILRQHQHQHEEHEQVEIREETIVAVIVRHVADGVNVDQQTHSGNHHQHYGGEPVDRKVDVDLQRTALNPGEVMLDVLCLERAKPHQRLHRPGERKRHGADGEEVDHRLRHLTAEETVHEEAEQREDRY